MSGQPHFVVDDKKSSIIFVTVCGLMVCVVHAIENLLKVPVLFTYIPPVYPSIEENTKRKNLLLL